MKSIHIKNSYKIWRPYKMKFYINTECWAKYGFSAANEVLRRSYVDMYIEWWLHNIGYYLTRSLAIFEVINLRFKDVDLEER